MSHHKPPSQSQSQSDQGSKSRPKGAAPSGGGSRVSAESVAVRAHQKFLARDSQHGLDQQDWILAERELISESRRS